MDHWNPSEVASALGGMDVFLVPFNPERLRER
jgi:hypothetical protein